MQDPTPNEHFWLMQMLGNFGAKQNLYFIFSAHSPTPLGLAQKRFRVTVAESLVLCLHLRILYCFQ